MTLLELLVAFMVLVTLVAALVALATSSLDTWSRGETRKDVYDRAQVLLDLIAEDIRNTYSENAVYDDGQKPLQPPVFSCDLDANRRPRFRFVRTGQKRRMGADNRLTPRRVVPPMVYSDFWEVAYIMDHDAVSNTLWRGVRAFDRRTEFTLLNPADYDKPNDRFFVENFRALDSGVLYASFAFWTPFTNTWDEKAPLQKVGLHSTQASGPATSWDSSRLVDKKFFFHRRAFDRTDPDFTYPEIVKVTLILESTSPQAATVKLAEACDENTALLRLSDAQPLPDAPGEVKIGAEWIEYAGKTLNELTGVRRGRRGTAAGAHPILASVHYGETFTRDVRVAAFREAQRP